MSGGPILYPNVTSLPGQSGLGQSERIPKKQQGINGEFDQAFEKALSEERIGNAAQTGLGRSAADLSQIKPALKFSGHATQRLQDRKIALDQATLARVSDAIDKAESKGVEDTLVLTRDAALIVSVKNRTVITAMDRNNLAGNVFTNIDGAVIV